MSVYVSFGSMAARVASTSRLKPVTSSQFFYKSFANACNCFS